MGVILRADNRSLTNGAKFSFLGNNYLSGVSTIVVSNSNGFAADDYVLLGDFGSETTEIVQVQSVTAATHTLTLVSATKFAHAESTRATIIPYNQVGFYHTSSTTFATTSPLVEYTDIQADDYYTRYTDTTNSTGYGWFVFHNATSSVTSTNSNAIPYAGFGDNTVERILSIFYSELNNSELKLISDATAIFWLNEGYNIARQELNLVSDEYSATSTTVTTTSGTSTYSLPTGFMDILSVWDDSSATYIERVPVNEVEEHDNTTSNETKYYLIGDTIGFSPVPTSTLNYTVRYKALPSALTSYYDSVSLPDNNYFILRDYMLYRASFKINRLNGPAHFQSFMLGVNRMKVTSHKRDNKAYSFEPDDLTIV